MREASDLLVDAFHAELLGEYHQHPKGGCVNVRTGEWSPTVPTPDELEQRYRDKLT